MIKVPCVCGQSADTHVVWHAWKVEWDKIAPRLSKNNRALLKSEFICDACRGNIKEEITGILERSC